MAAKKKNSGSVSLFSRMTYKDLKVRLQGCKGKASINMRREITFLAVLEGSVQAMTEYPCAATKAAQRL